MKNWKEMIIKKGPFVCILLGVAMIGVGFALADFKIKNMQVTQYEPFEKKEKAFSVDALSHIQLDTFRSEVTITASKDDQIHVSYEESEEYPFDITTETGTLHMKRSSPVMQFSWFDFEHDVSIPVILELPEHYLGSLTIENSYGNVTSQSVQFEKLTIDNSHGNVNLNQIKATMLSLDVPYGTISLNDINIAQELSISSDHGDLISKKLLADTMILSTSYTTITMDDTLVNQHLQMSNDHAPVNLGTLQARSIELDNSYGDIRSSKLTIIDDAIISSDHSEWSVHELSVKELEMESSYGDISFTTMTASKVNAELAHGSLFAGIKGSIDEYDITSNVEHGDNSLPTKYANNAAQMLQITVTYGDVDVKFQPNK